MSYDPALHRHTPSLRVVEPRGTVVRSVAYARVRASESGQARVTRHIEGPARRTPCRWDARLVATSARPLEQGILTLGGDAVSIDHADAGRRIRLCGAAGELHDTWEPDGAACRQAFDTSGRLLARVERDADGAERCVESRLYGGPSADAAGAAGRLVRHDDAAGRRDGFVYGVGGMPLREHRRFLRTVDPPDWPDSESALESSVCETLFSRDATGQSLRVLDASLHARAYRYDIAGRMEGATLNLAGGTRIGVVEGIVYDAHERMCRQVAGNGVVTVQDYDDRHGRLVRLCRTRTDRTLQDLRYTYDPVGNVLSRDDRAIPSEWFAGQRIDALDRYTYDSLYQLMQASGRESTLSGRDSALPELALPGDASRLRNYLEDYDYDASGNLVMRRHTTQDASYTQQMRVDTQSNRAIPDDGAGSDIDDAFDAAGRQRWLQPGQPLTWNAKGQLRRVTLVQRSDGDDDETYVYDADGARVRKVRRLLQAGTHDVHDVRYLPGLERHGDEMEVIDVRAGRTSLRVVHALRTTLPDAVRFEIDDPLGSVCLELDGDGRIVSYEGYLPYGGTAWWAGRTVVEATTRSRRHGRRERDATGLYHYGFRYYAPWLCRWLSPDPAGDVDGTNRYRFCRSSPVTWRDRAGLLAADDYDEFEEDFAANSPDGQLVRGLTGPLQYGEVFGEHVALVRQGIALAGHILGEAIAGIPTSGALPARTRTVFDDLFGPSATDGPDVAFFAALPLRVRTTFDRLRVDLVSRGTPGNDRILWTMGDGHDVASTFDDDPQARINIRLDGIENLDRTETAFTVIHEASHPLAQTVDIDYWTTAFHRFRSTAHASVADIDERYATAIHAAREYRQGRAGINDDEQEAVDRLPGGQAAFEQWSPARQRAELHLANADSFALAAVRLGAGAVVEWDAAHELLPRVRPRATSFSRSPAWRH